MSTGFNKNICFCCNIPLTHNTSMKQLIKINPILIACLMILSLVACKKEKGPEEKPVVKGDLQVTIQCQTIPEITSGASVYSDPPGIIGTTDATGTVLIKDIPIGTYQLFSYITGYGGGKTAISIQEGQLSNAMIVLIPGFDPGMGPVIESVSPDEESRFSPDDSISFSVKVKDIQTTPQKLKVKVESNYDGLLYEGNANESGYVTFKKKLSENTHTVVITVTDESNYTTSHSTKVNVVIPSSVKLNIPEVNDQSVSLSWSKSTSDDFLKYEVCIKSDNGEPYVVESINDINATSFVIEQMPVWPKTTIFIRVYTTANNTSESNSQTVNSVFGYIINETVIDAILDRETHSIYVHGRTKLYRIDYITKTLLATWNAPIDLYIDEYTNYFVHMTLADNGAGKELYISYSLPSFYGEPEFKKLVILNAEKLILNKNFNLPANYGIRANTSNGNGYFFVLKEKYEGYELYSIKRSNYQIADSLSLNLTCANLKHIPGKNEMVLLTSNTFVHIYHDNQGRFTNAVNQSVTEYFDFYDCDPFVMSPDGSFFLVSSNGRLYKTDSYLTYQNKNMNTGYDWLQNYCISNDNQIYGISYRILYKYLYPSLQMLTEMQNALYDEKFVFHDGTRLVLVNSAYPNNFITTLVE